MLSQMGRLLVLFSFFAIADSALAATNLTQLSGQADVGMFDDFESWAPSPDNERVVYIANEDSVSRRELFTVEYASPGASSKLSGPLSGTQQVIGFTISGDGAYAVYLVRAGTAGSETEQLFSVRADGSSIAVPLTAPVGVSGGAAIVWLISPTSDRVVYTAATGGGRQLFSVPIAGGVTATLSAEAQSIAFRVSEDGSTVVLIAGDVLGGTLSAIDVEGGLAIPLSRPGEFAASFSITADSASVVYAARRADTTSLVGSTGIDGTFVAELDSLPAATSLESGVFFLLTTLDSQRAVFTVVDASGSAIKSTPVAGGSLVTIDSDPFQGRVFQLSNDSQTVIFSKGDPSESPGSRLFSAPLSGGEAVELSAGLPNNSFFISFPTFDSSRVIFGRGDVDAEGLRELYSVPIAGGLASPASAPLQADGHIDFFFPTFDSQSLIYIADQDADEQFELFKGSAAGGTAFERLNDPLAGGGDVLDAFPTPDSLSVVYRADQDTDDVIDLFLAEGTVFALIFADGFELP